MTYTLIHYLSNGYDSCRGCEMGRSSSDFEYFIFFSEQEIVDKYAELLTKEELEQDIFGGHEYVVLIDGKDSSYSWDEETDIDSPLWYNIEKAAKEKAIILVAAKRLELQEAAKIKAAKDKEIKRQQTLNEIKFLQKSLEQK